MRLLRQLAILFLRSTARGSLVEALPADEPGRSARVLRALRLPQLFRAVGRAAGRLLTAAQKAHIQDYLINRYRIPVNLQRDTDHLRQVLRRAVRHVESRNGGVPEGVGDYLEFGVYQGNSMIQAHRALADEGFVHVRLFGFDSFAGLPAEADAEGVWSSGQYRVDLDFTRQRLEEGGVLGARDVVLVHGYFADTLRPELPAEHGLDHASLIMIDCDLYSSAKQALDFCAPLIRKEAVVLFDDWHASNGGGEKKALAEFLAENPNLEAEPFESYNENAKAFILRRLSALLPAFAELAEEAIVLADWSTVGAVAQGLGTLVC